MAPPSRRNAFSCNSAQSGDWSGRSEGERICDCSRASAQTAGAAILAGVRVAHHRAVAVIDLCFFARRGLDHRAGFRRCRAAQLTYKALDTLVTAGETMAVDQVLPDRLGVAAPREPSSIAPVRLAGAGRWTATGCGSGTPLSAGRLRARVGDHLIGRFCRPARPHPGGRRTGIPAARRYPPPSPAECGRSSMRRSDHPSRPSAMTCCFFSSLKTLLT